MMTVGRGMVTELVNARKVRQFESFEGQFTRFSNLVRAYQEGADFA